MPRGSRALLPAGIRTRPDRSPEGPMLSWAFAPLQSDSSHAVGAASRPLPSCAFDPPPPKRRKARRSRAFPNTRVGQLFRASSSEPTSSLEVCHQDLSSDTPMTNRPCRLPDRK
jgi:hypothetical protein